MFKKASKQQAKLRMALIGPSGSGKTYSALNIAQHLGEKVALIDTERGSASKYADQFDFDVLELTSFSPNNYIEAIKAAAEAGYDVLIIDSLSHAWSGTDGILEYVDKETLKSQSRNAYTEGWRKATPLHNRMVDSILQAPIHVIATMRAKTAYVMETDSRGKTMPKKVGMEAVQRDGLEYEFDVVADMNLDNDLIVSKSRCPAITGAIVSKPGEDFAKVLAGWLSDGTAYEPPKQTGRTLDGGKPEYNTNGARPYSGETVANKILDAAAKLEEKMGDAKADKTTCQQLAGCLDKALGGRENRLTVTEFLFDFDSTGQDVDGEWESSVLLSQAKAFFVWLGVPDGDYAPKGDYWHQEGANLMAYVKEQIGQ